MQSHLEELKVQRDPDAHVLELVQPRVPHTALAGAIDCLRTVVFRLFGGSTEANMV